MANQEILQEYADSVKTLKKQCLDDGMTEDEFRKLYFESLNSLKTEASHRPRITKTHIVLFFVIVTVLCAYNIKSIFSCLLCNIQEYIYPGLRLLRRASIPFVSLFPALTEFYHETCLIQNPFFAVVNMDCWPCSTISNVRHVYDPKPDKQHQNAPFIYETDQSEITMGDLKEFYLRNKIAFDTESSKVSKDNKYYITPDDMFHEHNFSEEHLYIWKFNTMNLARILRQLIPRPKIVPKFGQSTERFIIIESSRNMFRIPDTECSFSFVLVLSGERIVHLMPAEKCKHQCKTLKIELKDSYLLWYNWWYWRPVVQSSSGNTTFIAHVGSYC